MLSVVYHLIFIIPSDAAILHMQVKLIKGHQINPVPILRTITGMTNSSWMSLPLPAKPIEVITASKLTSEPSFVLAGVCAFNPPCNQLTSCQFYSGLVRTKRVLITTWRTFRFASVHTKCASWTQISTSYPRDSAELIRRLTSTVLTGRWSNYLLKSEHFSMTVDGFWEFGMYSFPLMSIEVHYKLGGSMPHVDSFCIC